jgi:hypothetical protein
VPRPSREEDQAAPAGRRHPRLPAAVQLHDRLLHRGAGVSPGSAIGDNRFSEASRAARIDARAHPVIAQGGPQIFGDPDARCTDLVSLIIATAASLRV